MDIEAVAAADPAAIISLPVSMDQGMSFSFKTYQHFNQSPLKY
jgi:succinyl-CoA synthetase beta subunit